MVFLGLKLQENQKKTKRKPKENQKKTKRKPKKTEENQKKRKPPPLLLLLTANGPAKATAKPPLVDTGERIF
jgi:hypothetical protein